MSVMCRGGGRNVPNGIVSLRFTWKYFLATLIFLCCVFHVESRDSNQHTTRGHSLFGLMKKKDPSSVDVDGRARSELIDIGIVASCVQKKFQRFVDRVEFKSRSTWMQRVNFLAISYKCKDPVNEIHPDLDNIRGYPLRVIDSQLEKFTRSSNINQLHQLVRPNARFLVVDVDMQMTDEVLKHVLKYVEPGIIYFPIVWSKFSPKHVVRVQREMEKNIYAYSGWEGTWRIHGYGMYAIHSQDLKRFQMNESFVGWGGEDNEFYERVKRDPNMKIIREKERGLIHVWHNKNCSDVVTNPQKRFACLGSKAAYLGSPLSMMLMMEDALEKARSVFLPALEHAPRILIVVPTSVNLLRSRLPGIMQTWGRELPPNIALKFFVSASVGLEAQHIAFSLGFRDIDFVAIDAEDTDYPPVRRNLAMLMESVALMDSSNGNKGYTWLLKVDDDTHVDLVRLQQLTYDLRGLSSEPHFIGGRGFGRENDRQFLGLPSAGFCMGGPGYLMTRKALLDVMPHLHSCGDHYDRHTYREFLWHSDVVISKCIYHWLGLECWDSGVEKVLPFRTAVFQQNYGTTIRYDSVTFHPLKSSGEMVVFHDSKKLYDKNLEES